jgi:hypothetical protein
MHTALTLTAPTPALLQRTIRIIRRNRPRMGMHPRAGKVPGFDPTCSATPLIPAINRHHTVQGRLPALPPVNYDTELSKVILHDVPKFEFPAPRHVRILSAMRGTIIVMVVRLMPRVSPISRCL